LSIIQVKIFLAFGLTSDFQLKAEHFSYYVMEVGSYLTASLTLLQWGKKGVTCC
jgi:hypothetical protein